MIPLSDVDRRTMRFPFVTFLIISTNIIMFVFEVVNGPSFVNRWALVPSQVTTSHGMLTIFTAMFMHGGFMHIAGNMIFLWAFGPEIEDSMGRGRYLAFYLLGGLIATFAQVVASPASNVPNLGASGAIAAVMGAFMVTYPQDRIRSLIFIFFFVTLTVLPAALLVGLWFLLELVSEVGSIAERQSGGIAYMAHIGGFIFGMLAARLFERRDGVIQLSPRRDQQEKLRQP